MRVEWENGWNRETFDEPLYFESFIKDMRFNSLPWMVVSSADIIYFGLATGDRNALHTDESFAKTTILGGVVAHGELVVNSLFGTLHAVNFWNKSLEALLEKSVRFSLPVRPEEKVKHFLHVVETRESKKYPDKGMVRFRFYTINQKYEQVAEGEFAVLLRKKGKKQEA